MNTGLPHPLFNGVFRAQLTAETAGQSIEAAVAHFQARKLPMFWWTGPLTQPTDLGARLEARGLTLEGYQAQSLIPTEGPTPPGSTVVANGNASFTDCSISF